VPAGFLVFGDAICIPIPFTAKA
ncbi:MAG: hypothetical protein QOI30_2537, partial [Mycobacterium sp.]|nr:hypothetical protein [Mycobacterium sp.]